MRRETFWEGFVQLHNNGGLAPIEIYPAEEFSGRIYVNVYVNGDLADDISSKEDLEDEYGERFFGTMQDFIDGNWQSIDDVWPKHV